MTARVKSLAETAVLLPPENRFDLAEQLLASFDETELEQPRSAEARRRRDHVRSGQVNAIPTAEVRLAIRRIRHETARRA